MKPEVHQLLSQSFYFDDFVEGVTNDDEGIENVSYSKTDFKQGRFQLAIMSKMTMFILSPTDSEAPSNVKVLELDWNTVKPVNQDT